MSTKEIIGFTILAIVIALVVTAAILYGNEGNTACQDAGGVAVRGLCIDQDVVIDVGEDR